MIVPPGCGYTEGMSDHEPASNRRTVPPPNVAAAYDRWSAQYDDNENPTRDLDARVVRQELVQLTGRIVLEVGCGTGKNTVWLAEQSKHVVALDFSAGMLAVARRRVNAANVRFVQHDVRETWPLRDAEVDVVIGNLVLEHVADLAPVYREAARVLKPGGQLFFCELHPHKQLLGSQARFTDPDTHETVHVTAFAHSMAEYVNGGLDAGFSLRKLGEWSDAGALADAPPRLVSLLFAR